jgi:hypothetical protein
VFTEHTLAGVGARSVVAALCLGVFITDHRPRRRKESFTCAPLSSWSALTR